MNQEINMYHSTITPDNTIVNCISIHSNEKENDLLFTYSRIAQRISLKNDGDEFETAETSRFYTGTKIKWCAFQDNILATLDEQNRFTLSSLQKSFQKIAEVQLERKHDEDYNVISYTSSLQFIFIASKGSDRCIVLGFHKGQTPTVNVKVFDDAKIIDSTRSASFHQFFVLVENTETGEKEICTIATKNLEITSRKVCSPDTMSLFDLNSKKAKFTGLIERDGISLQGKESRISFKSNIVTYSNVLKTIILVQTEDRHVMLVDVPNENILLEFEAQNIFKKLIILSQKIALGVFENGDNVVFRIDPSEEEGLQFTKDINQLDLESPLSIQSSIYHNNKLFVGDPRSVFTFKINDNSADEEEVKTYEMEKPQRLFCTNTDVYCLSDDSTTEVVSGSIPKSNGPLLNLFHVDNDFLVAVYPTCILNSDVKTKIMQHSISCADCYKSALVYCYNRNNVQIITSLQTMKKGHHKVLDLEESEEITCISMYETSLAIGFYNNETGLGKVRLYQNGFELKGNFDLPSRPTSILLAYESSKLYVRMQNGAIIQLDIDQEKFSFSYKISYIYFGTPGVNFMFVRNPKDSDSFFFYDKKVFFFSKDILRELSFANAAAFGVFVDDVDNMFIAVANGGKIKEVNFESENEQQRTFVMIENAPSNPIQMCSCGEYCFTLSSKEESFEIAAINKDANVVSRIEHQGMPNNFTAVQAEKSIQIVATQVNPNVMYAFNFHPKCESFVEEEEEVHEEIEFMFEQNIIETITSLASYGKKILFGAENNILVGKISDGALNWLYGRLSLNSVIQKIVIHKNRIWCCCDGEGITVVTYNNHDDRFEGIGYYPYKQRITALAPVDELLTAFSNENGEIYFIRIDKRVVLGLDTGSKIPKMQLVFRVNVHGNVSLIFTKNKSIYYLMDNSVLGVFIPSSLNTEFRNALRTQFRAVSSYSSSIGLFNPAKSFVSQKGVFDIDFIEIMREDENENSDISDLFASLALIKQNIM